MAAKRKAKKRATKRSATQVSAATSKKPGRPPKKSALIDAILAENKNLGAKDVQQKAKEQNVKISAQSVYNNATWKALHAKGAGRKGKSAMERGASRNTTALNGVQSDFTRCVKQLGIAKARELLDVIAAYENA